MKKSYIKPVCVQCTGLEIFVVEMSFSLSNIPFFSSCSIVLFLHDSFIMIRITWNVFVINFLKLLFMFSDSQKQTNKTSDFEDTGIKWYDYQIFVQRVFDLC